MKRMFVLLVGAILLFVSQSRADAVSDWNATAITVTLRIPNPNRSVNTDMAYLHIAIYDAVNAIDGRYSVFAVAPPNAAPWASKEAATATAARRVLRTFYFADSTYIDSVYNAALALLPNDSTKTRGVAIGDSVARRYLALRAGDGREASITYTWQPPGPGVYQPTPPGAAQYTPVTPWVAQLRPFSLTSASQFRAPGPASLTSDVYTRDFNEVKRYGSRDSSLTTPQQREMARFHTENPAVQLARNIRLFAASRAMSLADNARLFAQLYVTIGDATIAGFESKYYYNAWRPSTAIRAADTDGNPLTAQDTSWSALVTTPIHPEYPAAHGLAMGGLAYGVQNFFGTTNVPLTLTSNVTGTQHSFNNINELLTETVNARVYGGMHFRSSVEDGITIGRDVAAWMARRYFIRLNASPWTFQRAAGLPASVNPTLIFSPVNENVCWGNSFDEPSSLLCVRTTDGGSSWSLLPIQGATGLQTRSIAASDVNTAWVSMFDPSGATNGGIFKTSNGGIEWTLQTTALPGQIHFFDTNNGVVVGGVSNGNWQIYTTTNGGTNWTQVPFASIPPPASNEFGGPFATAGNNVWFGTFSGGNSIYRSTNRGITWSAARNVPGHIGYCVAFKDSLNGLACNCFEGLGNRLSRTTDGGATWTAIPNVPPTPSAYFISYVPGTRGSYVMTSTSNTGHAEPTIPGSAYSTDDGLSWTHVDNLPHQRAAFASPRVGWSGGLSDALYKWDSNLLVTGVKQTQTIAGGFRLEQNYPNPFNPSTVIKFEVASSKFVTLKVYDVLGREVRRLVNENLRAGIYETTFDATGLTSGVYYYRLHAGEFMQTKKLLLLR